MIAPKSMKQVVRIRTRILRLRRKNTWAANQIADAIEHKLLSRLSWTR
jgi:hypothetical protein